MNIKRRTTYTWETPDGEELEIPWEFLEGSELFKISPDGLSCILGTLTQDDCPQDPLKEFEEGELVIFGGRSLRRPDVEEFKRLIRTNPGRLFPVTYRDYGSSGSRIYAGNALTAADTKGDKRTGENSEAERILDDTDGYYICPKDVTDAKKYTDAVLKQQESYYNGDVYGVCVWTYTRDFAAYDLNGEGVPGEYTAWSEPDRDAECWGFYGSDYAQQELKEQFDATDFPATTTQNDPRQGELSHV